MLPLHECWLDNQNNTEKLQYIGLLSMLNNAQIRAEWMIPYIYWPTVSIPGPVLKKSSFKLNAF